MGNIKKISEFIENLRKNNFSIVYLHKRCEIKNYFSIKSVNSSRNSEKDNESKINQTKRKWYRWTDDEFIKKDNGSKKNSRNK